MKAATIFHLALRLIIIPFLVSGLALSSRQAQAQDGGYAEPSGKFSREELAQMLAPIALYPDALLSQVLMASTYPIEVIEADRWVVMNPELKGDALDAALLDQNWDPSVKAICHFPSILALMSERITETTNLGNAFLAQEAEVMDMVQELRAAALAQGNLNATAEQQVIVEKETIIIEPADPRVIYVPYYDPFYVYGPWWYPAYPPYYWGPTGVSLGFGTSFWPGSYFSFAFGNWSYFDWHRHYIHIDVHKRPRFVRHDRWLDKPGRWQHAPSHRRGVAYHDRFTARKYGQPPPRSRETGHETREFPENRQHDLERRGDDRTVIDRNKRGGDRPGIDRGRQERERVERTRKERELADRNRQGQQRVDGGRQEQERVERTRKERELADRNRQGQQRVNRDRQERERVERTRKERELVDRNRQGQQRIDRGRQERERVERARKEREPADLNRQGQQRADQEKKARDQVGREQQQGSRDKVFNRVEDGKREPQSSERGRFSRKGPSDDSRATGRSGGEDRGGRDGRGRNWR
jgi:hypothetical protein